MTDAQRPNQHTIPWMLQRGFAMKGGRKQIWVCRPGGSPTCERIKSVAKQDDFHPIALDDAITAYEALAWACC